MGYHYRYTGEGHGNTAALLGRLKYGLGVRRLMAGRSALKSFQSDESANDTSDCGIFVPPRCMLCIDLKPESLLVKASIGGSNIKRRGVQDRAETTGSPF